MKIKMEIKIEMKIEIYDSNSMDYHGGNELP